MDRHNSEKLPKEKFQTPRQYHREKKLTAKVTYLRAVRKTVIDNIKHNLILSNKVLGMYHFNSHDIILILLILFY